MRTHKVWFGWLLLGVISVAEGAGVLNVLPPTALDETVPTISQVLAYQWGEEISDPEQVRQYAERLVQAAHDRMRLIPYARSLEGRELFLLVVAKSGMLAKLDQLARQFRELGDPRRYPPSQRQALVKELPAVVWLMGSVHGDEASGGEALLALAYYLLAARDPVVEGLLDRVIVVMDPMQNPDGRARFIASTRQARGIQPALEPWDAEHVQPWPGGRFSHLLFDLNRDWILLTHPETRGRIEKMLWLPPQVVVDLHEMGAEQGYFFPPPAVPHNPFVSPEQTKLWHLLGRKLAEAFDDAGVRFWTREIFDAFYPGYGESWPFFTGACGATFEEASTRGRAIRLSTGEVLSYGNAVANHLLGAFLTVKTAAENKEAFLESWLKYRQHAVDLGKGKAFIWPSTSEPGGALAALLAQQGIEVYRSDSGPWAGYFFVPQAQPLGQLARVLLARGVPLPADFAEAEKRRESQRRPNEIYDVTAWSLPALWNVEVEEKSLEALPEAMPISPDFKPQGKVVGEGKVAFIMPWEGLSSAKAVVALLRAGVKAGVAEKDFRIGGRSFSRGSVVIFRRQNPEDLLGRLEDVAQAYGVNIFGMNSSFAEAGIDLGSNRVRSLKVPSAALLWDFPTRPTAAGHLRYALEYELGLPVTAIRAQSLANVELKRFTVIVFPDSFSVAAYQRALSPEMVARLKYWVEEGGVLVVEGEAASFLTQEKVGLLGSQLEKRKESQSSPGEEKSATYEELIQPKEEDPPPVPGAILTVDLDGEHVLTAGFPGSTVRVLANSRRIFLPLKLNVGRNLGLYAERAKIVNSGFIFDTSLQLLPHKAYFMVQQHKRGLVVAFAEPPAFRGLTRGSTLLLANAVLFGPAVSGQR